MNATVTTLSTNPSTGSRAERMRSLTAIRVYGAVPYTPPLFPDLQPGGRQSSALTVLHGWTNHELPGGVAA